MRNPDLAGVLNSWKAVREEMVFSSPHLQVLAVEVTTPTRTTPRHWTVVQRKAAVIIAPMTRDGDLILVQQERIAVRQTLWEFPAGQIEADGFSGEANVIRQTALRELREETGYELADGGELVPLGHFYPSVGFTTECGHLLLAKPVVPAAGGAAHDADEAITDCRSFTPSELRAMIARNEICDANTLAAFARLTALALL